MAWTRKAGAPVTANLQQAFIAAITGDATWGWLVDWAPLIGDVLIDVNGLCAAGPPTDLGALSPLDFLSSSSHQPQAWALSRTGLVYKLLSIAYGRVFSAYCESIVPTGGSFVTFFEGPPDGATYIGGNYIPIPTPRPTGIGLTRLTADTGGFPDLHWVGFLSGSNICNPTGPGMTPAVNERFIGDLTVCPTINQIGVRTAGTGGTFRLEWNYAAGTVSTFTPPAQTEPTGVLPPTTRSYASIADLGAELDRQEFKLDQLVQLLTFLSVNTALGPVTADAPVDAAAGPLIAPLANAYSITVSGVPAGADERFGPPVSFKNMGRYSLGSPNGWLPAVELSHSPLLVTPLPPGVDRIQVSVLSPATATITALYPPK